MILFAFVTTIIFGVASLLTVGAIVTTPGPSDREDWVMLGTFIIIALVFAFIAVAPWLFFVAGAS